MARLGSRGEAVGELAKMGSELDVLRRSEARLRADLDFGRQRLAAEEGRGLDLL